MYHVGDSTSSYPWWKWECGSAEITTSSRWRQHLQCDHSCALPRIYGSTAAETPLHLYTSDCPAGLFQSRAQRKPLPGLPQPLRSPAGDTRPERQGGPKHHHTPYPMSNLSTSPPDLHTCAGHPPVSPFLQKAKESHIQSRINSV